jgi:AIPR protein
MAETVQTRWSDIKDECSFYAEKYGYPKSDYGRGLEGYSAHLFAQEEGFSALLDGELPRDADLSDFLPRSADLGVDLVLDDEVNRQLVIGQSKWRRQRSALSDDEVEAFFSIHQRLTHPSFLSHAGPEAHELLAEYSDKLADGYSVQLRFVTNVEVPDDHRFRKIARIRQAAYEHEGLAIICELVSRAELLEKAKAVKAASSGFIREVTFRIKDDKHFELTDPHHALVCRVSGNELINLYRQHSLGLFALNVRLPMMAGRNPINSQIQVTAGSEPDGFFFYNNGVSAVCSDFELEKNEVRAERFQIINGAQTVGALNKSGHAKDVFVLFRLTATGEQAGGGFTESIIRFNNTQNPVKDPDFRANDPIQLFLQRELGKKFSGKGPIFSFYYQAKRGYRPRGRGGRAVKREDFANVRHAFVYGPVTSFKEPKNLWDNLQGGKYWEAFGIEGKQCDEWTEEVMAESVTSLVINERMKEAHDELKKRFKDAEPADRPPELLYLKRLSRYVTALVGVGLRSVKGDSFFTYTELLTSKDKFSDVVAPLEKVARTLVLDEFTDRLSRKEEVQTEYNFARSQEIWDKLKAKMESRTASGLI